MIVRSISPLLLFATLFCGVLVAAGSNAPAPLPAGTRGLRDTIILKPLSEKQLQQGRKVYNSQCRLCHELGANGAPRLGERVDWAPRTVKGRRALLMNTITGIGAMPPRGGGGALSDRDIGRALDYMLSALNKKQGSTP